MTVTLPEIQQGVIIRPMLTLDDAIDFACSSLADRTRANYTRLLHRFASDFPRNTDVAKITEDDFVRYLAGRRGIAKSTRAWEEKVLYTTFQKLYKARKIKRNPMEFVPRTSSPDPESLDLVRISSAEVMRMLEAAETTAEKLCVAILAYLGPRRHALALLRVRDYDPERKRLRFHEKGGKTIWKPVPDELAVMLDARLNLGVGPNGTLIAAKVPPESRSARPDPDDYLIPPEGPLARQGDRDDRVIWRLVKKVADRAGVDAHTHSLRAAFADFYLDSGGDGKALQLLMGHKNPATTERYITRYDRERRMEQVRGLSWTKIGADEVLVGEIGAGRSRDSVPSFVASRVVGPDNIPPDENPQIAADRFDESRLMGAGGFEPPFSEPGLVERRGSLPQLLDDLMPQKAQRRES